MEVRTQSSGAHFGVVESRNGAKIHPLSGFSHPAPIMLPFLQKPTKISQKPFHKNQIQQSVPSKSHNFRFQKLKVKKKMFRSNSNNQEQPLEIIRFQHEAELQDLKNVCAKIGITPSMLFSMHEGAFSDRPAQDRLRFHAAKDLANFYRRKYEASKKKRDLIRKTEISETNEDFRQYVERRDQRRRANGSVTFSQKNIDETSRRRAGQEENSIASHKTSKNSWVANLTRSSILGESILDCEGSIDPNNMTSSEGSDWWMDMPSHASYFGGKTVDDSYDVDADYSFDTIDGSQFRPHPRLMSTPNRNEAGMKPKFRNTNYEDSFTLSGFIPEDYCAREDARRGYCDEGFRSIMGGGSRLTDEYWTAYESQLDMESQMNDEDDEEYYSCDMQSPKFTPH